jgi:hypothetical protein
LLNFSSDGHNEQHNNFDVQINHRRSDAFEFKRQPILAQENEEEQLENYVVEKKNKEIVAQSKPELVNYVVERKKSEIKIAKPDPKQFKPLSAVHFMTLTL